MANQTTNVKLAAAVRRTAIRSNSQRAKVFLYPSTFVFERLQGLYRRALVINPSRSPGYPAPLAKLAYSRGLLCTLATYLVLPNSRRRAMLADLFGFAAKSKSLDGLEPIFLSGLPTISQLQDAALWKDATSLWSQVSAAHLSNSPYKSMPILDTSRNSIFFIEMKTVATLAPGGSNQGFLAKGVQNNPTVDMEQKGVFQKAAMVMDAEHSCETIFKLGGMVGGAVVGSYMGAAGAALATGPNPGSIVAGGAGGTYAGAGLGDKFGGYAGDLICGWAYDSTDVTATKSDNSGTIGDSSLGSGNLNEGSDMGPSDQSGTNQSDSATTAGSQQDAGTSSAGTTDGGTSGGTDSGGTDAGGGDDGGGDDDGMPDPEDPNGFPPDDPRGFQFNTLPLAAYNASAYVSQKGAGIQFSNVPQISADGKTMASLGYLPLAASTLDKTLQPAARAKLDLTKLTGPGKAPVNVGKVEVMH
jgi:hypothetical protein